MKGKCVSPQMPPKSLQAVMLPRRQHFSKLLRLAFLVKGVLRDLRGIGMQSNTPLKSPLKKEGLAEGKTQVGFCLERENLTASKSLMALVVKKKYRNYYFLFYAPRELSADTPVPNTQPRAPGQP